MLGFGINLVNVVLYIPLIVYFFSRYSSQTRKKGILSFLGAFVVIFLMCVAAAELFFPFWEVVFPKGSVSNYQALEWIKVDFSIQRLIQVLQESLIAPFYALETYFDVSKAGWYFSKKQNYFYWMPAVILFMSACLFMKKDKMPAFIKPCIGVIIIHLVLNYFYNSTWFLYTQNYLFYMIIILACCYSDNKNGRIKMLILSSFLLLEMILNIRMLVLFFLVLNTHIGFALTDAVLMIVLINCIIMFFYLCARFLKINQRIKNFISGRKNAVNTL